jgi:tRNA threonylcarbamoyladenosine biosynthesis protein TsaB
VLLAWDTSTDVVTVAVHDGSQLLAHRTGDAVRRHAEVLTPLIAAALADVGVRGSDLQGIAVGVGPGAYTGLRVGLVTAQTLATAWAVPAQGACSLDALAVQALHEHPSRFGDGLLVVVDARRGHVFWARYTAEGRRVSGPAVDVPTALAARRLPAVGSGALAHGELFTQALEPSTPDAGWLSSGLLDGRITPLPVAPLYLRQPDVTRSTGAKSVLQPGRRR